MIEIYTRRKRISPTFGTATWNSSDSADVLDRKRALKVPYLDVDYIA